MTDDILSPFAKTPITTANAATEPVPDSTPPPPPEGDHDPTLPFPTPETYDRVGQLLDVGMQYILKAKDTEHMDKLDGRKLIDAGAKAIATARTISQIPEPVLKLMPRLLFALEAAEIDPVSYFQNSTRIALRIARGEV